MSCVYLESLKDFADDFRHVIMQLALIPCI